MSQEEKEPKWISDKGRLELFPDSDFISQLAYGISAEQAKSKAASNISEYIKSSVSSSVTSNYFYKESKTGFTEESSLTENINNDGVPDGVYFIVKFNGKVLNVETQLDAGKDGEKF